MSISDYKPARSEELEREAEAWELRILNPHGWVNTPEALPRAASSTTISLRMPTEMLAILRAFARRERIGYQVLLKRWLHERIRDERDKLVQQKVVKLEHPNIVTIAATFSPSREQVVNPTLVA